MKKGLLLMLFCAITISLSAQNTPVSKANYRQADRFSTQNLKKLVFSTSVSPKWLKSGDKFWYSYKTSEGTKYYIVDLAKEQKRELFDNHEMASMLTKITGDPYNWQHLPSINPDFQEGDKVFHFDVTSTQDKEQTEEEKKEKKKVEKKKFHLEYNISTGELSEIKDWEEKFSKPSWASISPDGETILFARDYNLYWMDRENYEKAKADKENNDSTIVEHQITTDGERYYSWGGGYEPTVNSTEKDIKKESKKRRGAYAIWSQDSKKFAFSRTDSRKVKELWVIKSTATPRPELETYKYHMPGEKESPISEIWVFDNSTKESKQIDIAKFADQSVSICRKNSTNKDRLDKEFSYQWLSESSDKLFFTRISRDLHKYDLCYVDLATDSVNVVVEERMNIYVDVLAPRLLNNETEVLHWSERDGWGHFYLYNIDGTLKRAVTQGQYKTENIVSIDESTRTLFFSAQGKERDENPYYQHLYKVSLDGGSPKLLNKGNFDHKVSASDSHNYFIDNYSRVNTTPKSAVINKEGRTVLELETADLSNLFAAGYKFPEPFVAKAADGVTDIHGVMYKPFDFDSTMVYPIIEYVYPGPQTEAVNYSFSARMQRTDQFAQLGFIVITLGNRGGSPLRSKWYHSYGYNDLRDYGLADKKYVAEQLAVKYPFMNIEKVGICGHSGGGFMSTAAMLQYPDFFKVAVSSAGNHDNSMYNRWWSEKHHGVQEKINKEGESEFIYSIEKNPSIAKNLKGKLLLSTGDIDNNVHPGNTIRMANALINANKRFDMIMLPGQRHGFGNMADYFFWIKADYFCKHLIGDYSITTDIFEMQGETKQTPSSKRR